MQGQISHSNHDGHWIVLCKVKSEDAVFYAWMAMQIDGWLLMVLSNLLNRAHISTDLDKVRLKLSYT